ncbi:uncharacterized protein LOC130824377 [Amaranthus tricolor]|uniref:uncharacterized protein LOC130824377 n=1 Tax=Amaranthus tricolor TaxID=29722 RepID=UPI00258383CB|nr:uncharacterized protein LOC130824377 [Amaranthus tricolor]
MEDRELEIRRCKSVLDRIHQLPLSKITDSCKGTLLRLLNSEFNFLSTSNPCSSISSNVGYFEAIVHILQQPSIMCVSRVCKPFPLSSTKINREKPDARCESVYIDIVCCFHNNPTWFVVSDRNPKYITWESSGRNKGLKLRIEQIIRVAQCSEALKPASIVLFFANGLEVMVQEELMKSFGFRGLNTDFPEIEFAFFDVLDGEWVNLIGKSYKGSCTLIMDIDNCAKPCQSKDYVSEKMNYIGVQKDLPGAYDELELGSSFCRLIMNMKEWPLDVEDIQFCGKGNLFRNNVVNLDTTALVAITSGISNGGADKLLAKSEDELRQQFKNNTKFVVSQALSEIESPIYDELNAALSGKKGIACQSVCAEFMELVSMFGGPNEQMRANNLVKLLRVVPDTPSPRMMSLPVTRKLALKNKIAFGTGDHLGAPTLSANMGFVRAVSQTGMSLFTLEHRPRALVGD